MVDVTRGEFASKGFDIATNPSFVTLKRPRVCIGAVDCNRLKRVPAHWAHQEPVFSLSVLGYRRNMADFEKRIRNFYIDSLIQSYHQHNHSYSQMIVHDWEPFLPVTPPPKDTYWPFKHNEHPSVFIYDPRNVCIFF